jgi:hypothetical protein
LVQVLRVRPLRPLTPDPQHLPGGPTSTLAATLATSAWRSFLEHRVQRLPPRPVNAAGVAEAHRARRRTSQAMANVTVTEADFEEFVLDKGFVPLPADYTPTHLFFQAEAEGKARHSARWPGWA